MQTYKSRQKSMLQTHKPKNPAGRSSDQHEGICSTTNACHASGTLSVQGQSYGCWGGKCFPAVNDLGTESWKSCRGWQTFPQRHGRQPSTCWLGGAWIHLAKCQVIAHCGAGKASPGNHRWNSRSAASQPQQGQCFGLRLSKIQRLYLRDPSIVVHARMCTL